MASLANSVPLLILAGAVGLPIVIYMGLGMSERILASLPSVFTRHARPWVWLFGPLALISLVLLYPLVSSIGEAFSATDGDGGSNFGWALGGTVLGVIGNNVVWLVAFPVVTVVLALIAAVLFDRIRYEKLAMTLIVMPTAISFTAGAVIWTQMYSFQPEGMEQVGTLNALLTLIPGTKPVPWLQTPVVNNLALILIAVWMSLGVATLIISSAVKNVSGELLEAARLDGAGEWRIFFSITLPSILPAVLVVITTEVIAALKVFDIVYIMTNGNFNTDVLANRMYNELFAVGNLGHASAIAVILLLASLPIVVINIVQFRAEAKA